MHLNEKVAIVTGGNSGIGEAICEALAAEGTHLVVAGRRQDENLRVAARLAEQHGIKALPRSADVTDEAQCLDLIRFAKEKLGRLDILVNNAGRGGDGKRIADSSSEAFEATMKTNLYSAYWCSREAFRLMASNALPDENGTRGAIINIASLCGVEAWAESGLYCISKHGMMALSKTLADEGSDLKIRCAAICPGLVATPMTGVKGPDFIDPSDIAATALYLLKLRSAAWPTEIVVRRRGSD